MKIENKFDPVWMVLKKHIEADLQRFREMNDNDQTEAETARLRGNIEYAKEILALEDEEVPVIAPSQSYLK